LFARLKKALFCFAMQGRALFCIGALWLAKQLILFRAVESLELMPDKLPELDHQAYSRYSSTPRMKNRSRSLSLRIAKA
jgi:hypothetical protein